MPGEQHPHTTSSDELPDESLSTAARLSFVALVGAHALAQFGSMMILIILPWFVLQATGSAARTGFTGAALAAAAFVGGLGGGLVVDRIGFKRGSYLSDFVSAVAIVSIPLIYATVGVSYWGVLVLVFLARVLDIPAFTARRSLVPELASDARIPLERGNGIFEGAQHVAMLTGPAAAGVAIAVFGAANAFAVSAAVIFIAAIAVLLLVPREPAAEVEYASEGIGADMLAGVRFIYRERVILAILISIVGLNLLTTPFVGVILPVYIDSTLGNPSYLGLLISSFGVGTLGGAAVYAAVGDRIPRRRLWLASQLLVPLPFLGLYFELPIAALVLTMVLVGIGGGGLNPLMVTLRHERSPVHLRGRVFSTFSAATQLSGPIGMMIAGVLIEGVGLSAVLLGIASVAGALWVVQLFVPQFRKMERSEAGPSPGA